MSSRFATVNGRNEAGNGNDRAVADEEDEEEEEDFEVPLARAVFARIRLRTGGGGSGRRCGRLASSMRGKTAISTRSAISADEAWRVTTCNATQFSECKT